MCLFYLFFLCLPIVWFYKYVGWWAVWPGTAFWVIVIIVLRQVRKHFTWKD